MARTVPAPWDMTIDLRRAALLCTESELALVESARRERLASLTPRRLEMHIARARGLRDRLRELARTQRRGARGRDRTAEKAELFREVLQRFEVRASKLRASEALVRQRVARTARKGTGRRRVSGLIMAATSRAGGRRLRVTTPRATEPRSNRPARGRSTASLPARKRTQLARSEATRVRAHVASRNRRKQARRDKR